MMRKKIINKTIALLIAISFVYVQASAFTCGIHNLIHGNITHQHSSGEEQHSKNEKGCCSDFTQAFLSAFGKSQIANSEISFKPWLLGMEALNYFSFQSFALTISSEKAKDVFYPPPKFPDIRIFIGSFQI